MADTAHLATDKKLEEMEKRLSAIYSRAEKEIQKTADEYFSKFAKQDEAKRKLLEQGKITEDEYKKWRKGKVMYGKRFTEMKEQCAKQLLNVNKTALAYVNGELPEVYAINYNSIAGSVDGVGGYSFTLVDADTVRNLAVTDTSLLPYKELDPAKDIPWNMKKINAETLQGILQGESMDKIAKRILSVQKMNEEAAIRSARTIVTNAECKGRQDSYQRAKDDGIILRKYWLATYDKRARDWHKEAGNDYTEEKAIEIDDFFIVDGEKMLHPGDAMHGAGGHNLYNCRCSIASKVIGFKKVQVQKAMAEKQMGIEDAKTISDVETAFRNQDWFIHGEGSLAGWRSDDALSLEGLDVESAKYVYRTYERFFDKFPQMRGKLAAPVSAKKDRTVYADCMVGFGSGGISINKSHFYNYGKLQKSIADDFAKGWFSSKDIVMHELGHAMDDFLSVNQHLFGVNGKSRSDFVSHKIRPRILRDSGIKVGDIRTEVSEYATTNQHEWFAEVFAEYMSSESPRKCASSFGKWLEEVMEEVK